MDERFCGLFPRAGVGRLVARQLAHFPQVRLDQVDAFGDSGSKRRPGCVENDFGSTLLGHLCHPGVEILRHAAGQAAARNHKAGERLGASQECQALRPFIFAKTGTGQNKPVLLAGADLVDIEVLARFLGDRKSLACDAFPLEQVAQQAAGRAADWIDRADIASESFDDARNVDSASAGVTPLRGATKLVDRNNLVD